MASHSVITNPELKKATDKQEESIGKEIRNRIRLSLASYSYEFHDDSLMTDAEYDKLSREINPNEKTGNELIDRFFREEFMVDSGMWIRRHPELDKLKLIYETLRRK